MLYDLAAPWWMPLNDAAQQWVFGERGGSVDTVIVDGKVVVENGRALTIDEKAVLNAAKIDPAQCAQPQCGRAGAIARGCRRAE